MADARRELTLERTMVDAIVAHSQADHPAEACGLVAGRDGRAVALWPGRNMSPEPLVAFEVDFVTLVSQLEFEEAGLELVAIYHSHPRGPGTPSGRDVASAYCEGIFYLICSLAEPVRPVLRGFRVSAGAVEEIALRIVDERPGKRPDAVIWRLG